MYDNIVTVVTGKLPQIKVVDVPQGAIVQWNYNGKRQYFIRTWRAGSAAEAINLQDGTYLGEDVLVELVPEGTNISLQVIES